MSQVREVLQERAGRIESRPDALDRVLGTVRRRRIRRRVMATTGTALTLALVVLVEISDIGRAPVHGLATGQFAGSIAAKNVRTALGIFGSTKGASDAVVVQTKGAQGHVEISLVHLASGEATPLPLRDAHDASVSPKGDAVVAVTDRHDVVVVDSSSGQRTSVGSSQASGSGSWDRGGTALFALVSGRWVRVSHPGGEGAGSIRSLEVPKIPGGPILLSISPSGRTALLFGLESLPGSPPQPRLFIGEFDGTAVTSPHELSVPAGATEGPMGWVGDNAFLMAPGPGRALIVRTDGRTVPVVPRGIPSACVLAGTTARCRSLGPSLLGTNGDGSLMFWRIVAIRGATRLSAIARLGFYYRTWLDGSHPLQLVGPAARYGPPVAAR